MYVSRALNNATSQEQCVEIINSGTCEGMEGIEFSSEQLSGQYAAYAAIENGFTTERDIDGQLDCIEEAGARFERSEALAIALAIVEAEQSNEVEDP